jgi:hypothetical protein
MGQGGNLWQWIESATDNINNDAQKDHETRGGAWPNPPSYSLESSHRVNCGPSSADVGIGFRVASVDDSWLTNGLVAYYPFNGNANDVSDRGNNLTLITTGTGLGEDRFGESKSAFKVTYGSGAVSSKNVGISGNSDRTISLWLKPTTDPVWPDGYLLSWGKTGWEVGMGKSCAIGYLPYYSTYPDRCNLDFEGWYSQSTVLASPSSFLGSWHNVVVVYSSNQSNTKFYTDGVLYTNNFQIHNLNTLDTIDSPLTLNSLTNINGSFSNNAGIDGSLDDIRIYNRAFSSNEVAQLYAIESTPPPVLPPPTIATQPYDRSISLGQTTSFTIEATGTEPFSNQWMKDGVALTNQTNASLVITNAQSNAVGYYTCTVTDANSNSVTSSNAALNISGVPFWLWQGLVAYYPFNGDFKDYINPNSLNAVKAFAEPALVNDTLDARFQFLRKGYFYQDKNSTKDNLIFNRTVGLKDAWAKEQKKKLQFVFCLYLINLAQGAFATLQVLLF